MAAEEVEEITPSLKPQPSFEGRLKINDFMYTDSTAATSTSLRRSLRITKPLASDSPSTSTSASPSASPAPSKKRKRQTTTIVVSEAKVTRTSSPKKRNRASSSYAPPSTYAHLSPLQDSLAPNLLILFCGLNPGIQTARTGHVYAHPTNLFWRLMYSSGITPVPCKAEEDRSLAARYSLGFTNIVSRPSRNGAELSKAEMDAGVAALTEKCRKWRPEVICMVGKSIWESVWRVKHGKTPTKAEFKYGWQDLDENMGAVHEDEHDVYEGARVFVASSTSGLAATLRPEEKEKIWKELGDWCVRRREERQEEDSHDVRE